MLNPLDDQTLIRLIDTEGMLEAVAAFPVQCAEAVRLAEAADLGSLAVSGASCSISSIVTLGMGGSGIGGDVAKAMSERRLSIPFTVNKGYELPPFVDADTLVIAVSYSGETEETLTTFEAAVLAGAKIIVVSAGGTISARAAELNLPVVAVPAGLQPRAALGYLALPILIVLRRLELVPDNNADIKEAVSVLEILNTQYGMDIGADDNKAKQLADELLGVLPVVYGSDGFPAVAALRWKCQFNENAKIPAFWNVFPELDHNEIVGWQELGEITERIRVIVLRDRYENPRVKTRIELTLPLIAGTLAGITQVESTGESDLARFMSLVYLGDYASVYLALLNGVDPAPVDKIKELKRKLKEIDKGEV